MTTPTDDRIPEKSQLPAVVRACFWLTAVLVAAFPVVGWVAVQWRGENALAAVALAGGVCWFAAVTSLVVASRYRGQQAAVGVLLGMIFRMGPPLAFCAAMQATGGWFAKAGGIEIVVVYYLLALAAETFFAVRLAKGGPPVRRQPLEANEGAAVNEQSVHNNESGITNPGN